MAEPRRLAAAGLFAVSLVASGCSRGSVAKTAATPVQDTSTGVRINVVSVPSYTPPGATLYIAGNFNGWNPADSAYRLHEYGKGYSITLPATVRGPIEFKFTLGSWDAGETDSNGADIQNRGLDATTSTAAYKATIAGWRDPKKKVVKEHTAGKTVALIDSAFQMVQLNRTRRVWIYLPPDYATSATRYPVLYMHDGQNVFDNATSFAGEWGVDETLDSLSVNKQNEAIVVAVDHGGSKRFDEYSPWKNAKYGGGEGDQYVDFLVKTLKPYVDSHYRTLPDRLHTSIAGSSMGGLISLYAVIEHPDVFGSAGIFSPAFWVAPQMNDLIRSAGPLPSDTRLYFVIGGQEAANPGEAATYVNDQETVVKALVARGLRVGTNIQSFVKADGKHSEWFWRREFPAAYQWLLPH